MLRSTAMRESVHNTTYRLVRRLLQPGRGSSMLHTALFLACVATCSQGAAGPTIEIDASKPSRAVNPLFFGHNVPVSISGGVWNSSTGTIDADAAVLIRDAKPTVLRFPGGSLSDIYIWEDGLSIPLKTQAKPGDTAIVLAEEPHWTSIRQARFLDAFGGQFGDAFSFTEIHGTTLKGVSGFSVLHSPGAAVRPEGRRGQEAWYNNVYGINEHMQLAEAMQAQSIVTLNFSTGLDRAGAVSTSASLDQKTKRAAAWVAYLNGSPGDTRVLGSDPEGNDWKTVGYWAHKRATAGPPTSSRVIYWEVGNELFYHSEPGYTTARIYAQGFIAFAKAIKAVDPGIKVGAVGMSLPRARGDADSIDEWNTTVLGLVKDHLDYFIVHPYYPAARQAETSFQSATWYGAVMAGATQAMRHLREIREQINRLCPRADKIEIALTEYGIWPADSKEARDFSNLAKALYDADLLMGLLRHGDELGISHAAAWNLHSNIETAYIHYDWKTGRRRLRPQYHALRLVENHLKGRVVETQVHSPTFSSEAVGNMPSMHSLAALDAVACLDDSGRLALLVINRSMQEAITTFIKLKGYKPVPVASARLLMGKTAAAHNEARSPEVSVSHHTLPQAGSAFFYTFQPHSLTLLEFQLAR